MESELDISAEALDEAWSQVLKVNKEVEDETVRTTAELAERWGQSPSTVRARIRAALKAGLVERVTTRRMSSDGKMQPVPAYRLRGKSLDIG